MKKFTNIFILLFCIQSSFAQSLDISGEYYFTSDPLTDITHHLDIKNISTTPITIVCQKTVVSIPNNLPTWGGPSYCFAGNCYSASSTLPSTPAFLAAGQELKWDDEPLQAFSGYYTPAEFPGTCIVEYCFYDQNNPTDESCVIVTYEISQSTGVNENDRISGFFPNPANEYTTFNYTPKQDYSFELVNMLGEQVKKIDLSNSGQEHFSVRDLSKGIYFGSIIQNTKLISIKKLVVN